ncbi:ubiquinol cytochrome C oxidoreductase [Algoriphagus sp.]|uniref:ubiquinol cytochrome C oxidoreductase n=1 Tax=Algoriphagus sp. TaxID=1872435 RepID=UPI0025CDC4DF|nr:ubiquinol cytochrome C oxidoreductase [Algoriphagus sp.]
MKNLIAYRKPNIWTNVLSVLISITFMIVWLPFVRSIFDGSSYVWGTQYFGFTIKGAGITPSFIFIIAQLALYAAVIIGLYRMRNRIMYGALLSIWWINVFGNLIFDILKNGDSMFHGDTLNVHVSITAIILPLAAVALLLIVQVLRTEKESISISWTKKNRALLKFFFAMLPLLFLLLFSGEPHGITDQLGVFIAIAQCFYIPLIFRPFGYKHSFHANLVL